MAAPQSSLPLAPERRSGLPPDHVVNTQVPTLVNSACYQNSTGQTRKPDGSSSETNIEYPCVSEQEITGYCHQEFENDVEGIKSCLFNTDSSYESDHKCCIACRNLNGDGSAGTVDDADKFIQGLKDSFVNNNPGNRRFADVAAQLRNDIKAVQLKSKAKVEKGVADINILTYCPNPKLPQQAGSPKGAAPTSASAAPAATSAPAKNTTKELGEHKLAETTIEFYYLGQFSYGNAEASVATNGSASAAETAIVRMQQDFKLQYCVTCAAPGQSRDGREKSREASIKAVRFEPLDQKALPETCQKASEFHADAEQGADAKQGTAAEMLAVVNLDQCSCLPPTVNSLTPASPAAMTVECLIGDGKTYVETYLEAGQRIGIDVRFGSEEGSVGGPQSRHKQAEAKGPESPSIPSPKQAGAKGPKTLPAPKQAQPVPESDAVEQEPVLYCE
ncbi:hypothetical protein OCS_02536 [Ophiocordyceps sinensis CO18]|uniref:Uncharacterized protein n=1 Tax=Ophiocordyceps sinensis (strain Co18 / CGMCC 3.14243) TaxID=911162 RepID=T5A8F3_OPHSC|nr:hypothetical protein OCS_02536 [Ophiocordyceps sinensis CO18]